jgi:predicted transcriptional regulator
MEKIEEARRLRSEHGYSIAGAAREAGLTRSKVAYHLQGQRRGPEPNEEEIATSCPIGKKKFDRMAKEVHHLVKGQIRIAEDVSEIRRRDRNCEPPPPATNDSKDRKPAPIKVSVRATTPEDSKASASAETGSPSALVLITDGAPREQP